MKNIFTLGLAAWYIAPLIGCASGGDYGGAPMAKRASFAQQEAPAGPTPQDLLSAAARGNSGKIDALLSQGIDANSKNPYGTSALQLASAGGYLAAVQSLIAGGADVNAADNNGTTPLMAAAQGGFDDVVKALKAAGARGAPPTQQPAAGDNGDQWWKK